MATKAVSFKDFGFQPDVADRYRSAPRRHEDTDLNVHIFSPGETGADAGTGPMLVWFHAGGFRSGRIVHSSHRAIARWVTKANVSVAFPEYRLGAQRADLSEGVRARMASLDDLAHATFETRFRQSEALAALEDACACLDWIERRRKALRFDGKIVLGGASAGAITALNVVYLAPYLGLNPPEIGGVLCYSGGFAFPTLADGVAVPVRAFHNPGDARVNAGSIIALAERNTAVALTLSDEQDHGALQVHDRDDKRTVYGRLTGSAWDLSGLNQT